MWCVNCVGECRGVVKGVFRRRCMLVCEWCGEMCLVILELLLTGVVSVKYVGVKLCEVTEKVVYSRCRTLSLTLVKFAVHGRLAWLGCDGG